MQQQPPPNRSAPSSRSPQPHSLPRFVAYNERPRAHSSRDGRRAGVNDASRAYHSISKGTSPRATSFERMSHSSRSVRSSSPTSSPRLVASSSPRSQQTHSSAHMSRQLQGVRHGGSVRSPFNTRHSSRSTVVERASATGGTFPRNVSSSMFSMKGEDVSSSQALVRKSPRIESTRYNAQLLFADEGAPETKDKKVKSAPSTPSAAPHVPMSFADDYVPASVPMYAAPASPVVPTVAYDAPSFTPRYTKKRSQSSATRKRSATVRRTEKRSTMGRRRTEKRSTTGRHLESTTARRMEGSPSAPPLLGARSSPLTYSPLLEIGSAPPDAHSPPTSPVRRPSSPSNDTIALLGQHDVRLGSTSYGGDIVQPKHKRSSVAKHLFNGFNNVLGGGTKPADSGKQSSGSQPNHRRVSLSPSPRDRTLGRHQPKASASHSKLGDLRTRSRSLTRKRTKKPGTFHRSFSTKRTATRQETRSLLGSPDARTRSLSRSTGSTAPPSEIRKSVASIFGGVSDSETPESEKATPQREQELPPKPVQRKASLASRVFSTRSLGRSSMKRRQMNRRAMSTVLAADGNDSAKSRAKALPPACRPPPAGTPGHSFPKPPLTPPHAGAPGHRFSEPHESRPLADAPGHSFPEPVETRPPPGTPGHSFPEPAQTPPAAGHSFARPEPSSTYSRPPRGAPGPKTVSDLTLQPGMPGYSFPEPPPGHALARASFSKLPAAPTNSSRNSKRTEKRSRFKFTRPSFLPRAASHSVATPFTGTTEASSSEKSPNTISSVFARKMTSRQKRRTLRRKFSFNKKRAQTIAGTGTGTTAGHTSSSAPTTDTSPLMMSLSSYPDPDQDMRTGKRGSSSHSDRSPPPSFDVSGGHPLCRCRSRHRPCDDPSGNGDGCCYSHSEYSSSSECSSAASASMGGVRQRRSATLHSRSISWASASDSNVSASASCYSHGGGYVSGMRNLEPGMALTNGRSRSPTKSRSHLHRRCSPTMSDSAHSRSESRSRSGRSRTSKAKSSARSRSRRAQSSATKANTTKGTGGLKHSRSFSMQKMRSRSQSRSIGDLFGRGKSKDKKNSRNNALLLGHGMATLNMTKEMAQGSSKILSDEFEMHLKRINTDGSEADQSTENEDTANLNTFSRVFRRKKATPTHTPEASPPSSTRHKRSYDARPLDYIFRRKTSMSASYSDSSSPFSGLKASPSSAPGARRMVSHVRAVSTGGIPDGGRREDSKSESEGSTYRSVASPTFGSLLSSPATPIKRARTGGSSGGGGHQRGDSVVVGGVGVGGQRFAPTPIGADDEEEERKMTSEEIQNRRRNPSLNTSFEKSERYARLTNQNQCNVHKAVLGGLKELREATAEEMEPKLDLTSPVALEAVRSHQDTAFEWFVEEHAARRYFAAYLKKRYAVENLMFWLDCKEYSNIGDDKPGARLAKYDAIVEKYLTRGCEFEVNLQGSKVDKLRTKRDELDSKTFDQAMNTAAQLLRMPFADFLNSDEYAKYKVVLKRHHSIKPENFGKLKWSDLKQLIDGHQQPEVLRREPSLFGQYLIEQGVPLKDVMRIVSSAKAAVRKSAEEDVDWYDVLRAHSDVLEKAEAKKSRKKKNTVKTLKFDAQSGSPAAASSSASSSSPNPSASTMPRTKRPRGVKKMRSSAAVRECVDEDEQKSPQQRRKSPKRKTLGRANGVGAVVSGDGAVRGEPTTTMPFLKRKKKEGEEGEDDDAWLYTSEL